MGREPSAYPSLPKERSASMPIVVETSELGEQLASHEPQKLKPAGFCALQLGQVLTWRT
jgi:hypothetical protein